MTTIPIPAAVPDLPPLPIGALAACALDLLRETGDLPQPRHIGIYEPVSGTRAAVRLRDRQPQRHRPVGGTVRRHPGQLAPDGRARPGDVVPHRLRLLRRGRPRLHGHPQDGDRRRGRAARARGLPARARPPVRLPGL